MDTKKGMLTYNKIKSVRLKPFFHEQMGTNYTQLNTNNPQTHTNAHTKNTFMRVRLAPFVCDMCPNV